MIVVDSHHHLWDPADLPQPGLPPEYKVLDRAFLPDDLREEIRAVGVDYTVYVQGFPQSREGNEWMFRQANGTDFIAGVVAWVDLMSPESIGDALDELQREPKFVGIRHIVEAEPDDKWIIRPPVLESLKELARRGIPYDMLAKPRHLPSVVKVIEKIPDIRMVIDHIAKPDIKNGGSPRWSEIMPIIAQNSNIYCKLSGMATEADWEYWTESDLAPYVEDVIGWFGWERVMYGSDWPVCLLAGSYRRVWEAINGVLSKVGESERAKVFGENAIRFYGLNVGSNR